MKMNREHHNNKSRKARFEELRRTAEINAAANNLTEEEAIALVESIQARNL